MAALRFKEQGNALYKAGKYTEAVEAYTSAIEASAAETPEDPTYLGNRSAALLMLKKYDEAVADCQAATKLDQKFVKAYIRASKCYSMRAMLFEAKHVLNECISHVPDCAEALKELESIAQLEQDMATGKEHLRNNDYDRAGYYVDRILPLCPDSNEVKQRDFCHCLHADRTHATRSNDMSTLQVLSMRVELLIGRDKYDDALTVCWVRTRHPSTHPH